MGIIQSSMNQLFLSSMGAAWAVGRGLHKGFNKPAKPEAPAKPEVSAQTSSGMGNIAKIGRNYSNTGMRSYMAAARAVDSANDAITQKATSFYNPMQSRLEQVKAASSLSLSEDKGGSK